MQKTRALFPLLLALSLGCGAKEAPQEKPKEAPVAKAPDAAPNNDKASKEPAPSKETSPTKEAKKSPKKKPKEDKKLTTDDRKLYKKALNEARDLQKKKDYAGAIASFDKALALFPDDPRAMSEKGWAQFFTKDLEAAEKNTRDAIGRTTDTNLLGSSYYNLGRIQEERGEKDNAVHSYEESLRVRPGNKIVKERLASLSAAPVASDPLTPAFLAGPFPSLQAACEAAGKKAASESGQTSSCEFSGDAPSASPDESFTGTSTLAANGPILAARVFGIPLKMDEEDDWSMETVYHLGIQTKNGWYVSDTLAYVYNPGAFGIFEDLTIKTFQYQDLMVGGAQEIFFEFTHSRSDSDMGLNEAEFGTETSVVLCGVNEAGKPSCTGAITTAANAERSVIDPEEDKSGEYTHEGLFQYSWSVTLSVKDGLLVIDGTPTKEMNEEIKTRFGSRALIFP